MKNRKPECEGCTAYMDDDNLFCGLPSNKNGIDCPCLNCVVKSMCHLNICDNFRKYLEIMRGTIL